MAQPVPANEEAAKEETPWALFAEPPTLERRYAIRQDNDNNTYVLRLGHDPFSKQPRMIKGGNLVRVSKDGTVSSGRKAGRHYGYVIGSLINDYFEDSKELDQFDPKIHNIRNLLKGTLIQKPYSSFKTDADGLEVAQNNIMRARHSLHLRSSHKIIQSFRKDHSHSWIVEADDNDNDEAAPENTDTSSSSAPARSSRPKEKRNRAKKGRTLDDFIQSDSDSVESETYSPTPTSSSSPSPAHVRSNQKPPKRPPADSNTSTPPHTLRKTLRQRTQTRRLEDFVTDSSVSENSTGDDDYTEASSTSNSTYTSSSSSSSVKDQMKLDLAIGVDVKPPV